MTITEIKQSDFAKKEIKTFKRDLINKRKQHGSLIPLLQSAQDSYGYIPEKAILEYRIICVASETSA